MSVLLAMAAAAAPASSTVEELTVTSPVRCLPAERDPKAPAPKVVSSYPAQGAVVRPGVLVLRITFDRPMTCGGFFDDAPSLPNPCPGQNQRLVLSLDRRTVRTVCQTRPDTAYGVRLSAGPTDHFTSLEGRISEPLDLTFSTSWGPPLKTIPEALAEDR